MSTPAFVGTVPAYYDRCLGPVLFEPYAEDLIRRLPARDGLRVLETACGTGRVTRRLREALPKSATLVATDLFEPMLDVARGAVRAPGIEWQAADLQALPFEDESFDVVVCQFGLMFLPDKVQGFREIRRVLAPDGLLLANTWKSKEQNPFTLALERVVERVFRDDPPRFIDIPYGYGEEAQVRPDMEAAGWEDMRFEDLRLRGSGPSALEFAEGFALGSPMTAELLQRGSDPHDVA
jgi:SAM-dependent methyltransferase